MSRFVTGDETWVHHYDPASKQESMQWLPKGSAPPIKFKVAKLAGKVMATVFWDCEGILLVDYLPHNMTITSAYYSKVFQNLYAAIKAKRQGKLSRGILLHQDNAPVHTSRTVSDTIKECKFEFIPHPPYSPDLAPCDYFLFPKLKKCLREKKFESDEAVMEAVDVFFSDQDKKFYKEVIEEAYHHWIKCVNLLGDYVEKCLKKMCSLLFYFYIRLRTY